MFTEDELKMLRKLSLNFSLTHPLTDDELVELEEKVGDYLTMECVDDEGRPDADGVLCYAILDRIDSFGS